jgi:predicted RNA-binding Zn ribbon-like protein
MTEKPTHVTRYVSTSYGCNIGDVMTRPSAPGPLALVEAFLRTRDEIGDAADLDRWRVQHGLAGDVTPETYGRAMRLREALRSLIGGDATAYALVNEEITRCGLRPEVTPAGVRFPAGAAGPGDPMLGAILSGVLVAMTDGTWARMRVCAADDCEYAFYDHTRNRSGRWCDVAGCGANARMRAYRRRKGQTPSDMR